MGCRGGNEVGGEDGERMFEEVRRGDDEARRRRGDDDEGTTRRPDKCLGANPPLCSWEITRSIRGWRKRQARKLVWT